MSSHRIFKGVVDAPKDDDDVGGIEGGRRRPRQVTVLGRPDSVEFADVLVLKLESGAGDVTICDLQKETPKANGRRLSIRSASWFGFWR